MVAALRLDPGEEAPVGLEGGAREGGVEPDGEALRKVVARAEVEVATGAAVVRARRKLLVMAQPGRQGELRRDPQARAHASVSRCLSILDVVF